MRTKTLLLIAAVGAAGVATSMAQVFSVNAVGYVNKTIPANGFAMISNPLRAADNKIDALFAGVPNGTQVYRFTATGFQVGTYDDLDESFGAIGQTELLPGQGLFVRNAQTTPLTITFVGEVPQGTLTTQMPVGFSIVSSQVPQAGDAAALNFPRNKATGLSNGDQVYKFLTDTQQYQVATYDDLDDAFNRPVTFDVGEAVFVRLASPVTWTREFSVNQ
jgi:hypothetical protein